MLSGNTFRKDQKRIGSDVIYPWLSAFFSKCLQHERLKQPAVKCSEVPRKNCSSAAVRSHCIAKVPCRECFLHHFCPGRWNGLWMGYDRNLKYVWEVMMGIWNRKPKKTLQSLNWLADLSACVLAMEHQLKLQQTRCLQRATWFLESPLKSWGWPLSTSGEILRWCPCLFLSTEFRSCNMRPKKKWSCPDVSLFTIV
jgi:hypothetical protein